MTAMFPQGHYLVRLVEAEHRDLPSGTWVIRFVFEGVDPPYAGERLFHHVVVRTDPTPLMTWTCAALRTTPTDIVRDPSRFVGTEVLVAVKHRESPAIGVFAVVVRIEPTYPKRIVKS